MYSVNTNVRTAYAIMPVLTNQLLNPMKNSVYRENAMATKNKATTNQNAQNLFLRMP
jgi:hypothetical protein